MYKLYFLRRQQDWTSSTVDPTPPPPPPGSRPSRPLGVQHVRAPPPVPCDKKRCCHKKVFDKHFEINAWNDFVRLETQQRETRPVADAGLCMVCQQPVPGRRGWKVERSRHFHLFNDCKEYPYSKCNRKWWWMSSFNKMIILNIQGFIFSLFSLASRNSKLMMVATMFAWRPFCNISGQCTSHFYLSRKWLKSMCRGAHY